MRCFKSPSTMCEIFNCVLLENIWIEIYAKSSKSYAIGDCLEIMKASSTDFVDASEF